MRLLLDTHALIWWLDGDPMLSNNARVAIADEQNVVHVSAASAWEIATKSRLGKLSVGPAVIADFDQALTNQDFVGLPITVRHGMAAGNLPGPHRDPFDRMLIAQSMLEDLILVSNERLFDVYGLRRLW